MSEFVPEGWKVLKICDFAKVTDGAHKTPTYTDDGVPFLRVTDMKHKNVFNKGIKYISRDEHEMLIKRCNPEVNDILYSKNGTIGITRLIDWSREFSIFVSLALIKIKTESVTPFYLKHILNSEIAWKQIRDRSKQGTVTNLHLEEIKEFDIPTPPLPEQQKIAAILTSVDEVIEKTQAQINKLKDLKTGMMQELLTRGVGVDGKPHTEFKDSPVGRIPKAWDVVKLSKVLTKIDSGWSPACIEVPPQTGEWGVLKVSSVTRGEFLEIQSKTLPSNLEPKEHIKVNNGDLLLTRANGVADLVGKCVMIQSEPRSKLMMSDKILRLNPNKHIYSHFLLHAFNSQEMRRQIELSWGGSSGQKNISQADIKNYLLALPSFDEQKIIGDSISQVDRVLSAKNNKLIKMNNTKKALMQDLLTGKVRVKVGS